MTYYYKEQDRSFSVIKNGGEGRLGTGLERRRVIIMWAGSRDYGPSGRLNSPCHASNVVVESLSISFRRQEEDEDDDHLSGAGIINISPWI